MLLFLIISMICVVVGYATKSVALYTVGYIILIVLGIGVLATGLSIPAGFVMEWV